MHQTIGVNAWPVILLITVDIVYSLDDGKIPLEKLNEIPKL